MTLVHAMGRNSKENLLKSAQIALRQRLRECAVTGICKKNPPGRRTAALRRKQCVSRRASGSGAGDVPIYMRRLAF